MPPFNQINPPPEYGGQRELRNSAYLFREDGQRPNGGGRWLGAACAILCLSIAVALGGVMMNGRSLSALRGLIPVSSSRPAAVPLTPETRAQAPYQTATNPLRWADLTLLLHAGLSDEEIIEQIAEKQLVVPIGPVQEAALREMGAGERLLATLRTRRLYAAPLNDLRAPAAPAVNAASRTAAVVVPVVATHSAYAAPVDYVARDRQIASLQSRIDELDERIRRVRTNPDRYWYNRDYGIDRQQGMDRYLNQLDKERNDLRRQKWQLEGR